MEDSNRPLASRKYVYEIIMKMSPMLRLWLINTVLKLNCWIYSRFVKLPYRCLEILQNLINRRFQI